MCHELVYSSSSSPPLPAKGLAGKSRGTCKAPAVKLKQPKKALQPTNCPFPTVSETETQRAMTLRQVPQCSQCGSSFVQFLRAAQVTECNGSTALECPSPQPTQKPLRHSKARKNVTHTPVFRSLRSPAGLAGISMGFQDSAHSFFALSLQAV